LISEHIDFVLMHETELERQIKETRLDNGRGGHTGGNSSGHSWVSDPTAIQAIRAVSNVPCVYVPFGPYTCGERDTKMIRNPEKWLKVARLTRRYYASHKQMNIYYISRYKQGEFWHTTCEALSISKAIYYAMRDDIIHYASMCAVGMGLLHPYSKFC
jgi:hypothetical protein